MRSERRPTEYGLNQADISDLRVQIDALYSKGNRHVQYGSVHF